MGTIQMKDDGSFDQDLKTVGMMRRVDPRYSMKTRT